ncbi:MAG TPA: hypothetical protein PKE55_09775 [Kiritimatiellia bacterium]|nr:hypothetical protein [Kiritimatiellia bacterium]
MSEQPPLPPKTSARIQLSVSPFLLSAVVLPGLGQIMQGRRTAGMVFATSFLFVFLLLILVLVNYLLVVVPVIREALAGAPPEPDTLPPVRSLLGPLGVVLAIYLSNLIDVLLGPRKKATLEALTRPKRP